MKLTKIYILYISVVMLVLLIPFVGMAFASPEGGASGAEKREPAEWPDTHLEDGSLNVGYITGMGDYFQDHFALRDQMIAANSMLKNATVQSAAGDEVVIGRDGWLFYEGTLDDYLGRDILSARELYAVAHNIRLMQDYAEQNGSTFLFTIAPNKNSLYGQYMPYNYIQAEENNAKNLKPFLEDAGIAYADLYEAFGAEEELYLKRDSHWNNKGAALVYNTVMDGLGKEHETYEDTAWETRTDHMGDIDEMLYLMYYEEETQYYPDRGFAYAYVNDVADNMDAWIETANPQADGCLLMYRDSFGESLVPFFAEEFERAYFSRLMPYNLANIGEYQPDHVVLEKVERNLIDFVARAPILPGSVVGYPDAAVVETRSTIETATDGPYLTISGEVDPQVIQDKSDIYVSVYSGETGERTTYQACYLTNRERTGNEYYLYLEHNALPQGELQLQLIVSDNDNRYYIVQSGTV